MLLDSLSIGSTSATCDAFVAAAPAGDLKVGINTKSNTFCVDIIMAWHTNKLRKMIHIGYTDLFVLPKPIPPETASSTPSPFPESESKKS